MTPFQQERAPDVPVLSILKRHLETSVHYQQMASKTGNPEGYAYVKIPDWEVRQSYEIGIYSAVQLLNCTRKPGKTARPGYEKRVVTNQQN